MHTHAQRYEALLSDWNPVNTFFHKTFYLLRSLFFGDILLDVNKETHLETRAVMSERTEGRLKPVKHAAAAFLFSSSAHWSRDRNTASDSRRQSNIWLLKIWCSALKRLLMRSRPLVWIAGKARRVCEALFIFVLLNMSRSLRCYIYTQTGGKILHEKAHMIHMIRNMF